MWGQAAILLDNERLRGIIPTRVGTRAKRKTATGGLEDHPHACGDKTKEIKENSGFAKSTA